jgi:hypothetical protein
MAAADAMAAKHDVWEVKLHAYRAGLPGNVGTITVSAFIPAYKAGHHADLPATYKTLFMLICPWRQ